MAPIDHSNSTIPPEGSLEFLLLLNRIEAWVRDSSKLEGTTSTTCSKEECSDAEVADILQAKVAAYERSLLDRMAKWKDLDKASSERYRTRIEDLKPTLQQTLGMSTSPPLHRMASKTSASCTPMVSTAGPAAGAHENDALPGAIARELAARESAARVQAQAEADAAAQLSAGQSDPASAEPEFIPSASSTGGAEPRQSIDSYPSDTMTQRRPAVSSAKDVPWRQSGKKLSAVTAASQRGKFEEEMLDITSNMKGLAQSWGKTLKDDQKVLDEISSSQDKSQLEVDAANKKGKAMLWAGSLSFFKTMMMLAFTVVVFCLMIPFIIIT